MGRGTTSTGTSTRGATTTATPGITSTTSAATPAPPGAAGRRTAFALLGSIQITLIYTLAAPTVPLPRIARDFTLQRSDLILLSAAYGLAFAGLLLLGGRLADRYGGLRALTAGLALFAAASLAAPLAPGGQALLAARFAQGAGAALVAPAAMAVLRALFPSPAAHARAMATWGALSVLGATAGNLLSGAISALLSWRWALAVPPVVALTALFLAPRLLPGTAPSRGRSLDLPGAVLATGGISLVGYGLVVTDAHPWTSAAVLGPLSAGAALLAAFLLVERRSRDPLLPPRFLLDRRRAAALTAVALTACGTASAFVLLSLHFQQARDWSPLRTSAAFVPFAAALIACGAAVRPLTDRHGARAVTAWGLATGSAGLGLLSLTGLGPGTPYAIGLLPGLVLLAAGGAASFGGAAVLATEGAPARDAGLAGGVLNTALEFGPTVLFALLLTLGDDAASLAATAAAFAAVALIHLGHRRHARA
ncbi:MFS transporter [Streptomyces sp. A1547]|uniref:MFS transporter n=1 Tax=Streptomyces sp. A1547 TaxID=2563105 RepID=UPI00109E893A|nr:MFS transporter [Streptomyces sp. A1547]THA40681.1 MFS transporter [Streptomyces sp. A1547]